MWKIELLECDTCDRSAKRDGQVNWLEVEYATFMNTMHFWQNPLNGMTFCSELCLETKLRERREANG